MRPRAATGMVIAVFTAQRDLRCVSQKMQIESPAPTPKPTPSTLPVPPEVPIEIASRSIRRQQCCRRMSRRFRSGIPPNRLPKGR
jgi:hypothetical protein